MILNFIYLFTSKCETSPEISSETPVRVYKQPTILLCLCLAVRPEPYSFVDFMVMLTLTGSLVGPSMVHNEVMCCGYVEEAHP